MRDVHNQFSLLPPSLHETKCCPWNDQKCIHEFNENTTMILQRSSYPEPLINSYIKPFVKPVLPRPVRTTTKYVSCPYSNRLFGRMERILNENEIWMKLAPRSMANNRKVLFSRVKDERGKLSKKNSIFKVNCLDCDFVHLCILLELSMFAEHFNVWVNIKCRLTVTEDFPNHSMDDRISIVKSFYNKWDVEQSRYVFKDVKKLMKE